MSQADFSVYIRLFSTPGLATMARLEVAMSLGQRIVSLRKQKNWKQKDLAEKLKITPRQLVRWELDQVVPRPKTIEELAQILEVSVQELTVEPEPNTLERLQDEELRELLGYVPELDPSRQEALKMVLRDIIACHQFSRFHHNPQRRAS